MQQFRAVLRFLENLQAQPYDTINMCHLFAYFICITITVNVCNSCGQIVCCGEMHKSLKKWSWTCGWFTVGLNKGACRPLVYI